MFISSNLPLTDFEIVDFYGIQTCFAWHNNQLIILPFNEIQDTSSESVKTITTPHVVKTIRSFYGRVFIVCKPSGIYKLSRDYKLAVLSKTGIGLGATFTHVLVPKDSWLCLDEKVKKNSTILFRLTDPDINILVLDLNSTDVGLKKVLFYEDTNPNLCLVANGKNLFKLSQKGAQIVYSGDCKIVSVLGIKKGTKYSGFVLITDAKTIIQSFLSNDNELLTFRTICFDFNIASLTCGFIQSLQTNETFMVYADNGKVRYTRVKPGFNTLCNTFMISISKIIAIKNYKNTLLGLSSENKLVKLEFNMATNLLEKKKDFHQLDSDMLKCTQVIMDTICERAKELKSVNDKLLIHQDKLNRVNIYSHKQRISHLPTINVERTSNRLHLRVMFENSLLPQNSQIVVYLRNEGQRLFSSTVVHGSTNILELSLKKEMIDCAVDLTFDLITHLSISQPWCIIKNCLQEPLGQKDNKNASKSTDKINFLKTKQCALKKLVENKSIDMNRLAIIKNSLRKEFPN